MMRRVQRTKSLKKLCVKREAEYEHRTRTFNRLVVFEIRSLQHRRRREASVSITATISFSPTTERDMCASSLTARAVESIP